MIEEKIIQTIKKYQLIESGDNIVVGVSGGPDSMCLLNFLKENRQNPKLGITFNIYVAHINHGIREEAISDQVYVESYCKENNITCFKKQVNILTIAKEQKIGIEEAGRIVRYEFFNEVANQVKATKIATAHTAKDNIETVLMHFIRGTGTAGLKGIAPIREGLYIRPLLDCSREEIEQYCKERQLQPRIDKTNQENKYTRNKIRNELIPYLEKEFNPNIIKTLNRLSEIARQEDAYLQTKTKEAYQEIVLLEKEQEIQWDLKKFNSFDLVIKNRLVLYTINRLFGTSSGIEKIHLEDIIKLCGNNIGNKFLIPNKKVKIQIKNKKVFFIKNETFRK